LRGVQIIFGEGFDHLDKLRPDRGGLLGAELFPHRCRDPLPRLELAGADMYWHGARIAGQADLDRLVTFRRFAGDVGRRVEVVLPMQLPRHSRSA
jgi:hypothetical protein